jgi:hypothetical protein
MADEIVYCPSCNHKLRVPPELFGEPVQCPQCGNTFNAPVPSGAERDVPTVPSVRPPRDAEPVAAPPARGPSVVPPAVGLIAMSFISIVLNLTALLTALTKPEVLEQAVSQQLAAMGQPVPANFPVVTVLQYVYGGFLALALFVLFAGIALLMRRMYWLTVLGAVLAMANLSGFCCVPSAVFSIWALVVLFNPATRATFH